MVMDDRCDGIGGSDASIVLGINPWKSRLELWHEKVSGNVVEQDTPDTHWGKLLEPVIAEEYQKQTGRLVVKYADKITSKLHPFMFAHIDRLIPELDLTKGDGILEIKTKGAYVKWEEDIPNYYYAQMQHYLYVTTFNWGSFAVLDLGKKELFVYDIERDEKFIDSLIEKEKAFWNLVVNKVEPEVDGSEACEDFISRLHPDEEIGKEIDLSNDLDARVWSKAIREAREQIKFYEEQEQTGRNMLMKIMGNAERGVGENYSITWKRPKDKLVFDLEKFRKDNYELYKKYSSIERQKRRFIVRFRKTEQRKKWG